MLKGFASRTVSEKHLTFKLLEDVMLLPSSRYEAFVNNAQLRRIGPIVEYAYHHYDDADRYFRPTCDLGRYFQTTFQAIKLNQIRRDATVTAKHVEFFRPPEGTENAEDENWMRFCRRLEDAALKAGLPKEFSYALAGTFGEMTSNLIEHSEKSSTGLVGYRWERGEFEYVVADSGIGVLESLRSHPDFAWIADSGEALEQAACDGVSRFGRSSHRGTGFHDLLINIAHRNSYLRFRSGDHVYVIDGIHGFPKKFLRPCGQLPGLLISVVSHPSPSS
jgi:anti-sigma regulatory factor (Ser/Thr protein kinase)